MQKILHERLAAFDFSRVLTRAKHRNMRCFEGVDNACRQRIIGPDDGQAHPALFGKRSQPVEFEHTDRHTFRQLGDPGIAGCTIDFTCCGALG
ncbi:hypothetical protein D3C73_1288620 [compost metagenome]